VVSGDRKSTALRCSGHGGTKILMHDIEGEMSLKPVYWDTESGEDDILMSLRTKPLCRRSRVCHIYDVSIVSGVRHCGWL
jgi:hypothetical protein